MCGRKTLSMSKRQIIEQLMVDEWQVEDYTPSYNIAPTQNSLVLVQERDYNIIRSMRWGLIPAWSKNELYGSKMINARIETVNSKPSFKNLLFQNRCIVISDGYYEWKKYGNKKKPFFIQRKDHCLMLLAGLWTIWHSPSNDIDTYTILTKKPQKSISHIHSRMPVVLSKSKVDMWINSENNYLEIEKDILNDVQELDHYEVSNFVNSPGNNSIKCITPLKGNESLNLSGNN